MRRVFTPSVVAVALALAGCATVSPTPPHPKAESRGEELLWELDEGHTEMQLTEGMKGVLPTGLKGLGEDLKRDHGRLLAASTSNHDESPDWESMDISATWENSPLPMRIPMSFDRERKLSGIFFDDGAGKISFDGIADAIRQFPGDWSATAVVAEHPEVGFHYRSDVAQGMASQFKVLILAKACDEIAHGLMKEDDRVELTAAARGLPSCTLCNFMPGLKPSVHDVLHFMISTSDNTATDLMRQLLGWKPITEFARANGVEHPPALISTNGLWSLECSAGPLKKVDPPSRSAWLAELSLPDRVKAADDAASDAFQEGPEKMGDHCWNGDGPLDMGKDISHIADWPIRTGELVALYNRAQLGKLGDEATSQCFVKYLEEAGGGGVNTNDHIHKLGNKNGIESDIRSFGVIADTDRGHIALSISVTGIPEGKANTAYDDMMSLARSLVANVWDQAPH